MGGIRGVCGGKVKKHHIVALVLLIAWVLFAVFVTGWYRYLR